LGLQKQVTFRLTGILWSLSVAGVGLGGKSENGPICNRSSRGRDKLPAAQKGIDSQSTKYGLYVAIGLRWHVLVGKKSEQIGGRLALAAVPRRVAIREPWMKSCAAQPRGAVLRAACPSDAIAHHHEDTRMIHGHPVSTCDCRTSVNIPRATFSDDA
jgi:hypothetical protein